MNPLKRVKKEGISLKIAHILMIMLTFIIMCMLLFFTFRSSVLYSELGDITDSYIELQKSAESLMDASDYLTDKVQRFTVILDEADMNAYFDEAHNVRRREIAVEEMERRAPDKMAYEVLSLALESSVNLMDTEYRAMKLICEDELLGQVDIFDINMGCPVQKVVKTGAGSGATVICGICVAVAEGSDAAVGGTGV